MPTVNLFFTQPNKALHYPQTGYVHSIYAPTPKMTNRLWIQNIHVFFWFPFPIPEALNTLNLLKMISQYLLISVYLCDTTVSLVAFFSYHNKHEIMIQTFEDKSSPFLRSTILYKSTFNTFTSIAYNWTLGGFIRISILLFATWYRSKSLKIRCKKCGEKTKNHRFNLLFLWMV